MKQTIQIVTREGKAFQLSIQTLVNAFKKPVLHSKPEAENVVVNLCESLGLNIDNLSKTETGYTLGNLVDINQDFALIITNVPDGEKEPVKADVPETPEKPAEATPEGKYEALDAVKEVLKPKAKAKAKAKAKTVKSKK